MQSYTNWFYSKQHKKNAIIKTLILINISLVSIQLIQSNSLYCMDENSRKINPRWRTTRNLGQESGETIESSLGTNIPHPSQRPARSKFKHEKIPAEAKIRDEVFLYENLKNIPMDSHQNKHDSLYDNLTPEQQKKLLELQNQSKTHTNKHDRLYDNLTPEQQQQLQEYDHRTNADQKKHDRLYDNLTPEQQQQLQEQEKKASAPQIMTFKLLKHRDINPVTLVRQRNSVLYEIYNESGHNIQLTIKPDILSNPFVKLDLSKDEKLVIVHPIVKQLLITIDYEENSKKEVFRTIIEEERNLPKDAGIIQIQYDSSKKEFKITSK